MASTVVETPKESEMNLATLLRQPSSIEALLEHGITQGDITKLKEEGYHTIEAIADTPKKKLLEVKGISEQKAMKLLHITKGICPMGFDSAANALVLRKQLIKITTGSEELDQLLGGGGFEAGAITELFGEYRTGKTQICHTICVTAQLPRHRGGAQGKVIYIDTEGCFRPENIERIAPRFGVDPINVLENIAVARAKNSDHQMELLAQAAGLMASQQFGLIIVDSCTALFRTDYVGRGELAERQQRLAQFLRALQNMANQYGVVVVITNQVTASPDAMSMFSRDGGLKPIGGNILAHASTTRLKLRKGRGENRICKIIDSPTLPESEATFSITELGVTDPRD
eukprot:maker-scaffold_46-snap-gene-1.93-mRNA-1 protein AED:0.07 eAED:0.07 QI:60/1/1/1/1/1/6/156/342